MHKKVSVGNLSKLLDAKENLIKKALSSLIEIGEDSAAWDSKHNVMLEDETSVKNYGYYTAVSGVKWLYVQVTYNNIKYTGFCCGTYLKKQ